MTLSEYKRLKKGDAVKVLTNVKDHYGEIWHEKNSTAIVDYFTDDGVGVIFEWSSLGLHFSLIELI